MDTELLERVIELVSSGKSTAEAAHLAGSTHNIVVHQLRKDSYTQTRYREALASGKAERTKAAIEERKNRRCSVDECTRAAVCRNFCQTHYKRWLKGGQQGIAGPLGRLNYQAMGIKCAMDDCGNVVRCKGLCAPHYNRAIKRSACPTCGASKNLRAALCRECHDRQRRAAMTERRCAGCGEDKTADLFGWRTAKDGRTKPYARCRSCRSGIGIDPATRLERERRRIEKDKVALLIFDARESGHKLYPLLESVRRSARTLKLDCEHVLRRFLENGNRCDACGILGRSTPRGRVCVDHCHSTGAFRGFLCVPCNLLAGHAGDDVRRMAALTTYLRIRNEGSLLAHLLIA